MYAVALTEGNWLAEMFVAITVKYGPDLVMLFIRICSRFPATPRALRLHRLRGDYRGIARISNDLDINIRPPASKKVKISWFCFLTFAVK